MPVKAATNTPRDLRRQAKQQIDLLSPEQLVVAETFLAYLAERASEEATAELLRMPGMVKAVKEAQKDFAAGRSTNWRKVRRDV
jgi:hypothetical protein